jgi:hypothetical protein
MTKNLSGMANFITSTVVLCLLAVMVIATVALWFLGDWANHSWGLTLTLRILWGIWALAALGSILTKVTIFGWSFRRYFRWDADEAPPANAPRPTKAPWEKSPIISFAMSVSIVSVTGVALVATAVMWILSDVTGEEMFSLVFRWIWAGWWVVMVGLVLARVLMFDAQRKKDLGGPPDNRQADPDPGPPAPTTPK